LKPDISVVICAYTEERWDDLLQVVQSVQQQTHAPREIILVIDHNPQLLARVHAGIQGVVAVPNSQVRGLGGGRNTGLAIARAEVVAFLDDDAVAEADWLERLADGYDNPAVLGVGGAPQPDWQAGRPAWFPPEFNWVVGCTYKGMPETRAPVRNLFGCNMSFRRTAFDVLGGFRLGYGCDETEFCIRARQFWPDRIVVYEPAAVVHHKVPASRGTWRYLLKRCYFEGRSKAVVTWLVGARDGLASERAHALRILPLGVGQSLVDAAVHRDPAALARAAAIVLGLGATVAGYITGRLWVQTAARERGYAPPMEKAAVS
jgi:glucosyl-dolichyl phosphate glucuronosyltransferase